MHTGCAHAHTSHQLGYTLMVHIMTMRTDQVPYCEHKLELIGDGAHQTEDNSVQQRENDNGNAG
jgi:hypothetical protein